MQTAEHVRRIKEDFTDSDLEYCAVEDDGTLKFVFRATEFCQSCARYKSVFVMRPNHHAECADCDVKAREPVAV